MNPAFWHNKMVLMTGHTGFKGSWLSLWLQKMQANVVGYALQPPTYPSLFELASVDHGMTSVIGDVCDLAHLEATFQQHQPEIVIHMAAQSLVRQSYQTPVETYATNVMGTVNVLQAVRNTPSVRAVLVVTTDKCYENREWEWGYRENDTLGGHDPYANSKACAELVTASFRDSFLTAANVGVATARAGNVIGGGDWAKDRLIPDLMQAWLQNQTVSIRNPLSVRPWQHVLDPLSGYLTVLEHLWKNEPTAAQAWNFGPHPDDAQPVNWIVNHLNTLLESGIQWELEGTEQPHESQLLRLDWSKAREQLGWTPQLPLAEALAWVAEWYDGYRQGQSIRTLTESQIERYLQLNKKVPA